MRHFTPRVAALAAFGALALLAACRDTTSPGPAARLELGTLPDTVGLGDTLTLAAHVVDRAGARVDGATIAWTASIPSAVEFFGTGNVRAMLTGPVWLVARATLDGDVIVRDSMRVVATRQPRGIVIQARSDELTTGDTMTVVAHVVDGLGVPYAGQPVRYRSTDTLALEVDSVTGLARVLLDGEVGVRVTGAGYERTRTFDASLPRLATGGVALAQIDLGWRFGCGLDAQGAAYCWGSNFHGQLGRGTWSPDTGEAFGPVRTTSRYVDIGAGRGTACGVTTDGGAECWGASLTGWVRDEAQRRLPNRVPLPDSAATVRSVHMGDNLGHCLLDTGGINYCWGNNAYGAIGSHDSVGYGVPIPRPVPGTPGTFRSLHPGDNHGCGVRFGMGAVYCWGQNRSPQDLAAEESWLPREALGLPPMRQVALGLLSTCALDVTGVAWCWGRWNSSPMLPVRIAAPAFTRIEASLGNTCGMTAAGAIHCWSNGDYDEGIVTRGLDARPFSRRERFVDLAVGPHAVCGLTSDGAVYCREGTPRFGFR